MKLAARNNSSKFRSIKLTRMAYAKTKEILNELKFPSKFKKENTNPEIIVKDNFLKFKNSFPQIHLHV